MLSVGLAVGAAVDARAGTGLAELRLFVSPERRAALDDEEPSPGARESARVEVPANGRRDAAAAARGTPRPVARSTERSGTPPGTATVRSSRGTSRIVDGVPLPGGPS